MAASIRAIQASIALVNVIIFSLVFTSIWPFPSGDFNVDLPSPNEVEWAYSGGVVTVSAPYSIDNGGLYDVVDLVIDYDVRNYTNAQVYAGVIDIGTVPAGHVTSDTMEFSFPLLEMYEEGNTWMVFNDDFLNLAVEVSCYYTMELIHFYAEYRVSVPWDALIREVAVDGARTEGTQLLVDYHVTTSEVLQGGAYVAARLMNGTEVISETVDTVALGGTHSGTLAFDLPLVAVPDRIVLTVQAYEFSVTETITFDPGWLA